MSDLTQEQLKAELSYDPETGIFGRLRAHYAEAVGSAAGNVAPNGRRSISVLGVRYLASHLAVLYVRGYLPQGYVKQRDRNYDNLAWSNLYEETPSESVLRGKVRGQSGVRGVSWEKSRQQWQATIAANGKVVHLGRYEEFEAAVAARQKAEAELAQTGSVGGVKGDRSSVVMEGRLRRLWNKVNLFYGETAWPSFAEFMEEIGALPQGWLGVERVNDAELVGPKNWRFVKRFDRRTAAGRAGYLKQRRTDKPHIFKDQELRKAFGISLGKYQEMLDRQNGVCMSCNRGETQMLRGKVKSLAVDHDHATGAIRDLLCSACNVSLGLLDDSLVAIIVLASYRARHGSADDLDKAETAMSSLAEAITARREMLKQVSNVIPLCKESA